ncbi:hypothetical protein [Methanobrevibacter sp.]|uniref:hypothetical protein n=1 Tax=Methanobrevibacter sp. TaxID=66852 RepID=UPI00386CEF0A
MLLSLLISRLNEVKERHSLSDLEVTANKINGKSFLIFKNDMNEIVECLILLDKDSDYFVDRVRRSVR